MPIKSRELLIDEIIAAVPSNGQPAKTTAAGVRGILTSLVDEIIVRTEAPTEPAAHAQNSLTPPSEVVAPTVDAVNAGLATVQAAVDAVVNALAGLGGVKRVNNQLPDAAGNVNTNTKYAADYALGQVANPPPIDFRVQTQLTLVGRTAGIAGANYAINGGASQPFVFTNNLDARGITVPAGGQLVLSNISYTSGFAAGTLFFEGTQA